MRVANSAGAVIEVHDLVKRYKKAGTNAVDGVSFSVDQGEFFSLLGPNGAGKTTTISILTTILEPTGGQARIGGYDVVSQAKQVRRQIGIIFQQPSLDLNLTAEENVRFHAILYNLYPFRPTFAAMPRAYQRHVHQLADVLGLEDDLFKPVRGFSGGMKRKLEIVRSLIHDPRVLFLDEPTVGLDPLSRRNLWDYLDGVRKDRNTTVFLTTHYLDETENADRVCIISKGKVVSMGTPASVKAELASAYLLVDAAEGEHERLLAELTSKQIPFEDVTPVKIPLRDASIYQIVRAIDTPLAVVETHTPTLEDAYLSIIGRGDDQ